MVILAILLLSILGLCQHPKKDKHRTVSDEKDKSTKEFDEKNIPCPPPMPKKREIIMQKNENINVNPSCDQKISFSPPVWLCEIETNKLFNKVKLELAESMSEDLRTTRPKEITGAVNE